MDPNVYVEVMSYKPVCTSVLIMQKVLLDTFPSLTHCKMMIFDCVDRLDSTMDNIDANTIHTLTDQLLIKLYLKL